MDDLLKLARIQIQLVALFVFAKWIRPSVLAGAGNDYLKLFLLSFPNLCEGAIGVLVLTGIGIYVNKSGQIKPPFVYATALVLAAVYVVTQELKFHNLGGNNVYDPNDLIFSVIGLFIGAAIVFRLQPKMKAP